MQTADQKRKLITDGLKFPSGGIKIFERQNEIVAKHRKSLSSIDFIEKIKKERVNQIKE